MNNITRKFTYPCKTCRVRRGCHYRKCVRFMNWFCQEWRIIRAAAQEEREKNG